MSKVFVLHDSRHGHTANLARFQGRHVATVSAEVIGGRRSLAAEIYSQEVIGSTQ